MSAQEAGGAQAPGAAAGAGAEPDAALALDDYRLKLGYLTSQYDRMWNRFNFFLSIETALFGFLGYLTFDEPNRPATVFPLLMGVAVSLLWYVVGAQDRALVSRYRTRADDSALRVAGRSGREWFAEEHAASQVATVWESPVSWYLEPVSITRLPAIVALLLTATWLLLLVFWGPITASLGAR